MPVSRSMFADKIVKLQWPCPTCQEGTLQLSGKLVEGLTAAEEAVRHEDYYNPQESISRFVGLLKCDNADCKEHASLAGDIQHDYYQTGPSKYEDDPRYFVTAISPAPFLFPVSDKVPEIIKERLAVASALFWADADASANRLGQVVEDIFTDQRVKRFTAAKTGHRAKLSLHARIEIFERKNPEAAKLLFAMKWLRNTGSHDGELSKRDLIDGFELVESVIEEIYIGHTRALRLRADQINKLRGPVRTTKPKKKLRPLNTLKP